MEQVIRDRYSDAIKAEVLKRFGIDEADLKPVGGFESFIYEFPRNGEATILRVSHSARYTQQLIRAELDFLDYLGKAGANIAAPLSAARSDSTPLPSPAGNLLEVIEDGHGGEFLVTAFEKAKGEHQRTEWTDAFMQHYGATIGKLHRLSSAYIPSNSELKRNSWDAPEALNYDAWLLNLDAEVHAKFKANIAYLRKLPKDKASYGLIHQDAHAGNFFVHEGQITLFDFADACYGYFINDIAMVLFYALTGKAKEDPEGFTRHFFSQFWQGYCTEFSLDKKWLRELPYFFKLREIDLYAVIERDTEWRTAGNAWLTTYMEGRRERILNDVPYVDVDFEEIVTSK